MNNLCKKPDFECFEFNQFYDEIRKTVRLDGEYSSPTEASMLLKTLLGHLDIIKKQLPYKTGLYYVMHGDYDGETHTQYFTDSTVAAMFAKSVKAHVECKNVIKWAGQYYEFTPVKGVDTHKDVARFTVIKNAMSKLTPEERKALNLE